MMTRRLTPEEFAATRINPQRVNSGQPVPHLWQYVEAIPVADFCGFDCRTGAVTHVYRMNDQYEHILVNSEFVGVAMVIVVDLVQQDIYGHFLLDINPPNTEIPE
ncbi:MAG: hypothetical protein VB958_11985 [Thalassolituus sp.]|uniref:hypothetical protein n=1 Tax=Thalassolituus TaxID=187492 RepID=UPI000BD7F9DF|nr:hypothetical protein [Thalassolituus oleivorans]MDF1639907.1 hypothetical protein [Thalassolituus oleivorans]PCI48775.1 MAG: hypothetical protein COB43_06970 [Oceanospirillales bacterium]